MDEHLKSETSIIQKLSSAAIRIKSSSVIQLQSTILVILAGAITSLNWDDKCPK